MKGGVSPCVTRCGIGCHTGFFVSPSFPGTIRLPQLERDGVQVWAVDVRKRRHHSRPGIDERRRRQHPGSGAPVGAPGGGCTNRAASSTRGPAITAWRPESTLASVGRSGGLSAHAQAPRVSSGASPHTCAMAVAACTSSGTAACPWRNAEASRAASRTYSWIMKLRSCRASIHAWPEATSPSLSARAMLSMAGPTGSAMPDHRPSRSATRARSVQRGRGSGGSTSATASGGATPKSSSQGVAAACTPR